jgi:hypothetical protein
MDLSKKELKSNKQNTNTKESTSSSIFTYRRRSLLWWRYLEVETNVDSVVGDRSKHPHIIRAQQLRTTKRFWILVKFQRTLTRFWLGATILQEPTLIWSCKNLTYWAASSSIVLISTWKPTALHTLELERLVILAFSAFKKNYREVFFSSQLSSHWYKLALVPLGTRFCNTFRRSLIRSLLFCIIRSRKTSESSFRQQQAASTWNYMQHHRGCRANFDLVTLA